jgi:elongation factor Ts
MSTVQISAADVNKLRIQTGAGMMDCKKALMETNGDFEAAIDFLRKKGAKIAANRSDRESKEGAVIAKSNANNTFGVVLSLNCETDFVAKNADFVAFAEKVADAAIANNINSKDALLSMNVDGLKVSDHLLDQTGKIGEKIEISVFESLNATVVVPYIHAGNRLGVLVGLSNAADGKAMDAGKDVAMQIAAMNPIAVNKEGVSADVINREIEIAKEQIRAEGKPEEMVEKIALGKLNKFYKDNTLLQQDFVKDGSKTIAQMLDDTFKGLTVTEFKRVALGA